MRTYRITRASFNNFKDAQVRPRADWPATFSCNHQKQVWPFIRYGFTPLDEREDLSGQFRWLDKIVQDVLALQPAGGRFHIDDNGVHLADNGPQVARFKITG